MIVGNNAITFFNSIQIYFYSTFHNFTLQKEQTVDT